MKFLKLAPLILLLFSACSPGKQPAGSSPNGYPSGTIRESNANAAAVGVNAKVPTPTPEKSDSSKPKAPMPKKETGNIALEAVNATGEKEIFTVPGCLDANGSGRPDRSWFKTEEAAEEYRRAGNCL